MIFKKRNILIVILLIISIMIPIVFSLWFSGTSQNTVPSTEVKLDPVAYVDRGGIKTNYQTLDRALYNAVNGDRVVIYPNKGKARKATLFNDAEIKKGVTLVVPYSIGSDGKPMDVEYTIADRIASLDPQQAYLQTEMIINSNATLTNHGNIIIGGVISGGSGGNYSNGQTCGNYGQITLGNNSKLINESGSNLTLYGIIKEKDIIDKATSLVVMRENTLLKAPFIVNEHRGGTNYLGMYNAMSSNLDKAQSAPFNRWHFGNVLTKIRFENGSRFVAHADLYAQSRHNHADINILGQDNSYLINMQVGTFVECTTLTRDAPWSKYNHKKEYVNHIDIYGSFSFNTMIMTIVGKEIKTNTVLFPLTYHQRITLNPTSPELEASADLNQNIKLMPGAFFKISKHVTANTDRFAVYDQSFQDVGLAAAKYPSGTAIEPAEFIVEGFFTVNKFGGNVKTINNGALFVINRDATITSYEVTEGPNKVAALFGGQAKYQAINLSAIGDVNDGVLVNKNQNLAAATPYEGVVNAWKVSDNARKYDITYHSLNPNGYDVNKPAYLWKEGVTTETRTFYTFNTNPFTITSAGVPSAFCEYFTMIDWTTDEAGNNSIKNGVTVTPVLTTGSSTPIHFYSKFEPTKYKIQYNIYYPEEYPGEKNTSIISAETYDYVTNKTVVPTTIGDIPPGYEIASWYQSGYEGCLSNKVATSFMVQEYFDNAMPILNLYGSIDMIDSRIDLKFDLTEYGNQYQDKLPFPSININKDDEIPFYFVENNKDALSITNHNLEVPKYLVNWFYNDIELTGREPVIANDTTLIIAKRSDKNIVNIQNKTGERFEKGSDNNLTISSGNTASIQINSDSSKKIYTSPDQNFTIECGPRGKYYNYTMTLSGSFTGTLSNGETSMTINKEGDVIAGTITPTGAMEIIFDN